MKIGIAGGGLLGRLLCLNLLELGHDVTVFDKDCIDGDASCAASAAGMLSLIVEIEKGDEIIYQYGLRSMQLWPKIVESLSIPHAFRRKGSILIAHHRERPLLQHFIRKLNATFPEHQFKEYLSGRLQELEPELTHVLEGYFFENEGQVLVKDFMPAISKKIIEMGALWKENMVVNKIVKNSIITDTTNFDFDRVFDCRGLGAKEAFSKLRGIRGELLYLHAPEVSFTRPIRFLHPRYPLYIVPQQDNVYLVGASEIECEDFSPISVRTNLELLSAAYSVHPGFSEARILSTHVNCRPAFPDNLPQIKIDEDAIRINGLYRHGYLIAPALVEEIIQKELIDSRAFQVGEIVCD